MDQAQKPADYEHGFGEIIRAHRMYVGLNQREMAAKLDKNRRDYQRIESDQDACPPGLLTKVEAITDAFDDLVSAILDAARKDGRDPVPLHADTAPGQEWTRLAVGRAAIIAADEDDMPAITLTMSGNNHERAVS